MLPVSALGEVLSEASKLFCGDPAFAGGDFFGAADHEPLPFMQSFYKSCCFEEGFMDAGTSSEDDAFHATCPVRFFTGGQLGASSLIVPSET